MVKKTIDEAKKAFDKTIEHLIKELGALRTGRAHTSLVENIMVSYYGTPTPMKQVASLGTPEAQQILIDPFDKSILKDIEKAIAESDTGLNPQNNGKSLRITIPPLTEERRRDIVHVVKQKIEEARVSVRTAREDAWKKIKDAESKSEISEDEKYKAEEDLNKVTHEYNDKIKEIGENKEKEVMTV